MSAGHRAALRHDLRAWVREVDLPTLLRRHGSPLLVLEPHRAAARYAALRAAWPFVRCHYAVKTLDAPEVLRAIADDGGLFEVASAAELDAVIAAGGDPTECLYTHPIKRPADIDHAYRRGVRMFVVDNTTEIDKFAALPTDIRVLLRLSFPNPGAVCDLSAKFGAHPDHTLDLVRHAEAVGVRIVGLSFHVGSQTTSAEPYRAAIIRCLQLIELIYEQTGRRLEVLDIGGGFPVAYDEGDCHADDILDTVRDLLVPEAHRLTLLAEPGRFVAATCMTLITTVVGVATRNGVPWYYLDDGVYGAYSNVAWEHLRPPILALSELIEDPMRRPDAIDTQLPPCTLGGPTCDSIDVIATDLPMPPLHVGDELISPTMGAYTLVTACRFNGLAGPEVAVVGRPIPQRAPGLRGGQQPHVGVRPGAVEVLVGEMATQGSRR